MACVCQLSCLLSARGDTASQLVVLYKYSVDPGNGAVSFLAHNDKTGQWLAFTAENLRRFYESRDRVRYICSTVVFAEFGPSVK